MEKRMAHVAESSPSTLESTNKEPIDFDPNDPIYDAFRRNDVPHTHPLEIAKMVFVIIVLLPIRLFFIVLWLSLYFVFVSIGMFGWEDNKEFKKPIPKWRRWWLSEVFDMYRWAHGYKLTDMMLLTFGIPFIIERGECNLECPETGERANLIVCNHSSYMDIFLLMHTYKECPAFVAKKEVANVPFFGWLSRMWQCIFVDRFASEKGGRSATDLICERSIQFEYPPVVIFPEGTTTNGNYLMPFRSGAFVPGRPIKPVLIRYPAKRFSLAWESCKFPYHVGRMMTQVYNLVEIIHMPVYVPSEEEKKNPKLFAENVRKAMAQVGNIPLTEATLEDKVRYIKGLRGSFDAN